LLERNFYAERPNLKWCTDISYIPTKEGFVYLSVIKHLYDNFVAYKAGSENNNLVYKTVKTAKREVTEELQLHSDQGFQYTSEGCFKLTQSYRIAPSISSPGSPLDNACAENFFSILKSEWLHRYTSATKEERLLRAEYIHVHNYERIKLKTKLTPYEKRCQFQEITSF
jgi:transposase InsO family protein